MLYQEVKSKYQLDHNMWANGLKSYKGQPSNTTDQYPSSQKIPKLPEKKQVDEKNETGRIYKYED